MILAVMVPHSAYKALVRKHDADKETDREGRFLLSSDRSSVKFIVKVLPAAAGIRTAGISAGIGIIRGQTTNIARQGFNRGLSPNCPSVPLIARIFCFEYSSRAVVHSRPCLPLLGSVSA